ncbi:PUA domain/NOL1/NOP2/sun family [Leishmania donovani]|uniref:PUA_domain/NOL1/NOP2/sun_family_putative/Pfam:PF0 1472/Pfam:PF01189 n=1 Tax=Leishmania donovani TaxID=5661 RepID=A0A6J8FHJ3_LEIDO|nr:PUA domain/NOL1/NOP2/sun family [Leishmania donovani]VDZ45348.1 PUA_domain/NOL1/NOP2/sun_family_putative/Pfam:PF01472/Pfam:PF01189 [Leishmania donovani]
MISLDAYARYVYQYSSPTTTEHLRQTVWGPLGLCSGASSSPKSISGAQPCWRDASVSHEVLYAVPPITTNVRCVGSRIEAHLTDLLEEFPLSSPTVTPTTPAAATLASRFARPSRLATIGLPFCLCVKPQTEHLTLWPLLRTSSTASSSPTGTSNSETSRKQPSRPLVLVVDAGAAEAVLRGSDLYAPGIVTASRPFHAGERAVVAFYVERVADTGDEAQNGSAEAPRRLVCALPTGATLPAEQFEPLDMDLDYQDKHQQVGALAGRSTFLVCIGSGVMCMEWKTVMSRSTHGTALQMEWTPQGQPSRATLRALLGIMKDTEDSHARTSTPLPQPPSPGVEEGEERAADAFFLQNYSSMVPVALLVQHLSPAALRRAWTHSDDADQGRSPAPCTILDACAAPGGKTSLLLSLLQERAEQERTAMAEAAIPLPSATEPFRVVCCERSRPRQEQLMRLLHRHFASHLAAPSASPSLNSTSAADAPYVTRVLESHCVDTNKFLKRKLTEAAGSSDGSAASHTDSFDAVLLDPPCTGMGLRPKLMPHAQSIASIQRSADYQRKLFDSCIRHIRGSPASPGVIVYSTCTTTLEENEANVLHFLCTYPSVRLARARTAAQRALCDLSAVRSYGAQHGTDGSHGSAFPCSCLLQNEITEVQLAKERAAAAEGLSSADPLLLLRFMPRPLDMYDDISEDGVGFFVAVFLCSGYTDA